MAKFKITINGNDQIKRALTNPQLVDGPIRGFLEASVFTVEAKAKELAPVDRGRLRQTIRGSVKRRVTGLIGLVRAGVRYAPFVEFGTRPHWPPRGALQPWARRHGFPAGKVGDFLVRRKIAQKGTDAQPFMEPAIKDSRGKIEGFLVVAGRQIERMWERGF
jgi:HK97 gp10 family phage protein